MMAAGDEMYNNKGSGQESLQGHRVYPPCAAIFPMNFRVIVTSGQHRTQIGYHQVLSGIRMNSLQEFMTTLYHPIFVLISLLSSLQVSTENNLDGQIKTVPNVPSKQLRDKHTFTHNGHHGVNAPLTFCTRLQSCTTLTELGIGSTNERFIQCSTG